MRGQGMGMPGTTSPTTMMDPKQYEQFFKMWTDMLGQQGGGASQGSGAAAATPPKQ